MKTLTEQLATLIQRLEAVNKETYSRDPIEKKRQEAVFHDAESELAWWVVRNQKRLIVTPPANKFKLVEFRTEDGYSIIHEVK